MQTSALTAAASDPTSAVAAGSRRAQRVPQRRRMHQPKRDSFLAPLLLTREEQDALASLASIAHEANGETSAEATASKLQEVISSAEYRRVCWLRLHALLKRTGSNC